MLASQTHSCLPAFLLACVAPWHALLVEVVRLAVRDEVPLEDRAQRDRAAPLKVLAS